MHGVKAGFFFLLVWSSIAGGAAGLRGQSINFGGYTWNVRSGTGGPGPNYWSNSTENVWLDSNGYLHMKIRKVGQIWYCSEVFTTHYTQYGDHRFVVECSLDSLDNNVVVGLFNYRDDTHEIDIEFARWGVPGYAKFGSYTIQPYTVAGNSESFAFTLETTISTHSFNWQNNYIAFTSFQGINFSPTKLIKSWVYTGAYNPKDTDKLRTHINFWLFEGKAPVDTGHLELIIRDIRLPEPLGTAVEPESNHSAGEFDLGQNYPNPFNHSTKITYQLPSNSQVVLDVFDSTGQQVSSTNFGEQNAGRYSLHFDAQNLASGIYYYRLSSARHQRIKKMILMK